MLTEIMSNATCPNCGATLIAGAKFCRQCGRLVSTGGGAQSVTEATTRTLHAPAQYGSQPTDFFSPPPTTPAYIAPNEAASPAPAYATSNLEPSASKRNAWLIGLLATLLIISLMALVIIAYNKNRATRTVQPPPVSMPEPPSVGPPEIPQPPSVLPPANGSGTNPISRAFIYPGAETVMELKTQDARSMIQLRTKDSYQQVVDWYTAKLKHANVFKPSDSNAIIKSDKIMAIINSSEAGTMIMLKGLDEDDFDFDLDQ